MQKTYGTKIADLKVDGGACKNNFLMQFQADMLNCRIIRPQVIESTAQGAAYLAGVAIGLWNGQDDLKRLHATENFFHPGMDSRQRKIHYSGWQEAIQKAIVK